MKLKQNRCHECVSFDPERNYCLYHKISTQGLCFCKSFSMREELGIKFTQYKEWLKGRNYMDSTLYVFTYPVLLAKNKGLTEDELLNAKDDLYLLTHGSKGSKKTQSIYRHAVTKYEEFVGS